ncbi:ribosomal large subunit pseudouridylate synthase, putative [Plasmodium gallinaceum]|uniref:Ribosomal large subunit pseudouridylate synthase, putative n=1 Tax=Plasmodium gallinaceum TaxID=5849 RepID=A0A1J1GKQ8_PLAGA|nr:ribosomal large subunit pseudouridylate synthase, putative [Plasmodium gallinaceum]CRG92984.1 ribosomal large subunit pseudouridylate synthase, putative [Plasmodium gallinaceum]
MYFGKIFYDVSKYCKQNNILFLIRKYGFSSKNNFKYFLKENTNMIEDGKVNIPSYKSYKGHKLKVIYENDFFFVVNKPYDIKLEKGKYDDIYPSVETLIRQEKKLDVFRICGQLDYATSGLLIVAKDKLSSNILNYNIECKNISKIYLAILYGHLPLDIMHINAPISKIKNEFKMKLCYNYNDYYDNGKYCYSLIYPFKHCYLNNQKVTLCEMRTITGRRHQLRLHSIYIGSGIVGDETYFEDMIINKYKINCSNSNNDKMKDENNNYSIKKLNNDINDIQNIPIKKIELERMMLHCWIILKNKNKQINKLNKSENINFLEDKIFDTDYIICDDELSHYVNEKQRTYEECVLKNDDLININFINYNVKNINKNIKNIDKKLNKKKYDSLLYNSLILENLESAEQNNSNYTLQYNENKENKEIHIKNEKINEEIKKNEKDIDFINNKIETINVTDTYINNKLIDNNLIYKVKNDKYKNPNDLFDDIHDSVNKFNWG